MSALNELPFTKGHGTANDFILIPDSGNTLNLSDSDVASICDRRTGIGADGVIRVVPTERMIPDASGGNAGWFMDYRNSDGSLAEMCGNGARVFARFLFATGRETQREFSIATRAGTHQVVIHDDSTISVCMGPVVSTSPETELTAILMTEEKGPFEEFRAIPVWVPNPHAVVSLPVEVTLADVVLESARISPSEIFSQGVNIEIVQRKGPQHVAMRVLERGSGETMSCGTGACAVAWVFMNSAMHSGDETGINQEWQVDVPGGSLWVRLGTFDELWLRGPAELVAEGTFINPSRTL